MISLRLQTRTVFACICGRCEIQKVEHEKSDNTIFFAAFERKPQCGATGQAENENQTREHKFLKHDFANLNPGT